MGWLLTQSRAVYLYMVLLQDLPLRINSICLGYLLDYRLVGERCI